MVYMVTYSNKLYEKARQFCSTMAILKGKVDRVIEYTPEDMDEEFRSKHAQILNIPKGNGMWLWKPYFINKALNSVNYNDIIIYMDAASFFIRDCKDIVNCLKEEDIWVSNIGLIEKQFTKPSLFANMECKSEKYYDTNQIQGSFFAAKKTQFSMEFTKSWLYYCCTNDNILDPVDGEIDNLNYKFIQHRYDQSILSLLCKKNNIVPHLDPSQYGRFPEFYHANGYDFVTPENYGEYPVSIILHRSKEIILKEVLKMWAYTWMPISFLNVLSKRVSRLKG